MISNVLNHNDITTLWRECFGDSDEDILFFLDNCRNKTCVGIYENNQLYSMLFLVDCKINSEDYKYVYAACTLNKARNSGMMSELLKYITEKYRRVCLIPAEEYLIRYYKNRKFIYETSVSNIQFNESKEICEYLFEGCNLKKTIALSTKGV